MNKIKYLLILIIIYINLINGDEKCSWDEPVKYGESCSSTSECEYPGYCSQDGICEQLKQQGDDCSTDEECGLFFYGQQVCRDGICQINLKNGDPCGEGHPGICQEGTYCQYSRCQINENKCELDQDCPFNHYCEDNSKTCTPIVTQNSCSRDTMCPITHICYKSQCISKYTKELMEPCFGNGELCGVFSGEECDSMNKICKINNRYGSSCYVDGDCGAGKCICEDGNKRCVGSNTTLVNDNCLRLLNNFMGCTQNVTNRDRCYSINPILCSSCFKEYECFKYQCFGSEKYDPKKSSYYKSLKCSLDEDNENVNNSDEKKTKKTKNNSNISSKIYVPIFLIFILIISISIF